MENIVITTSIKRHLSRQLPFYGYGINTFTPTTKTTTFMRKIMFQIYNNTDIAHNYFIFKEYLMGKPLGTSPHFMDNTQCKHIGDDYET